MKKLLLGLVVVVFSMHVARAQGADFVQGWNVIFEDNFERDPVGDFPAKWNASQGGEVVELVNVPGKWLKLKTPAAASPELLKALPENCTIEFDLYLHKTSGNPPHIMFGLTSLSDLSSGNVYRNHISVKLMRYTQKGTISYQKNHVTLGNLDYALQGSVGRIIHVSMSINKARWRVYLDDEKVIDLPSVLSAEFRKNFFIASSVVLPNPEEGIYISNVRIGAGEADARSLLIKQLMEEGAATTNAIGFNPNTNELTPESYGYLDQIGQIMQKDGDMNIQINSMEEVPYQDDGIDNLEDLINVDAVKRRAEKMKAYLVKKFKVKADRIKTDAKAKIADKVQGNKAFKKADKLFTEFIKL